MPTVGLLLPYSCFNPLLTPSIDARSETMCASKGTKNGGKNKLKRGTT